MLGNLLLPEIRELIESGDFTTLRDVLQELPAPDVADIIADLQPEDEAVLFRVLPRQTASDAFEYLPRDTQEALLRALGQEQVADLINLMAPDDRTALLEELPAEITRRLLELLSPEELAVARRLLGYPEGSVGRLMTPDYVAIRPTWTIQQVLDHVRAVGHQSETLNVLYVTDKQGLLLDDIRIREILLSPPDGLVSDIMDESVVSLRADMKDEAAVELFKKYDLVALPVTDSDGVLVGIVTVDDVLDVQEAAATEDIQMIGAVEALDDPYMATPVLQLVRKRAPWLIILFVSGLLTATALGSFEAIIAQATILVTFMPLIISSGGNSGSQAASLVIRAMALGELTLLQWWHVLGREILSGLGLGAILAAVGFGVSYLWCRTEPELGQHAALVASTVAVSLIGVVMWGTIVGSMLPFVMRRLGLDPAVSSTPFVATLVDVTGIVIYFTMAIAILRGALL